MPAPTLTVGAPCWIDLYSSDTTRPPSSTAGSSAGRRSQRARSSAATSFLKDGKHVAGCMANSGEEGYPDAWTVYLMADDADRTAEAAAASGGQVHLAPMDVAENGRMAMIGDPGQAAIGVWQPIRGSKRGSAPPPGSSCTRGTTTAASTSTATCSGGTRTR